MKPSKLFERDYTILTLEEKKKKEEFVRNNGIINIFRTEPKENCPTAVKFNLSLFPNNNISLRELKSMFDIKKQNSDFRDLISKEGCLEQEVLNYINRTPAYHIVGSIIKHGFAFGHHEIYLFKEMKLGDKYRTDYVLVGKGSGGFQFVLVEFEKPEGRITLKDGHLGEAFRKGENQLGDWKTWMEGNFETFSKDLASVKGEQELPEEFRKYDSTRFHYVAIAGRRKDFSEMTYRIARDKRQRLDILLLHHDNLYENSVELETARTF